MSVYMCLSWLGSIVIASQTYEAQVAGSSPARCMPGDDLGQVVHTHVPMVDQAV